MSSRQRLDGAFSLLCAGNRAAHDYSSRFHLDGEIARVHGDGCQTLDKLLADGLVTMVHGLTSWRWTKRRNAQNVAHRMTERGRNSPGLLGLG
jgi:hypothetical protein